MLQFIAAYKLAVNASGDVLFWGDEVEYAVCELSGEGEEKMVKLALVSAAMREHLNQLDINQHNKSTNGSSWHAEYGSWMIEGTPSLPYAGFSRDLVEVEINMRYFKYI